MPRVYCTGNHLPSCARCACPVCIALAHILILALQARASVRLHTRRVESSISAFVLCAFSALGTSALSFLCAFSALGQALSSLRLQRSGQGPFFSARSAHFSFARVARASCVLHLHCGFRWGTLCRGPDDPGSFEGPVVRNNWHVKASNGNLTLEQAEQPHFGDIEASKATSLRGDPWRLLQASELGR